MFCLGSGADGGARQPSDEVFYNSSHTRIEDIVDGAGNTAASSEQILGHGGSDVLTGVVVWTGADQPARPKPRDPQSSFEPRSGPGAGQEFLRRFAGDWDVTKRLYLRPGDPIQMQGECRQTMINDGRFLKSEFVFRYQGTESSGLGVIGYEAGPDRFTSFWTDSRSTRMSVRQSREPFNGKEIVLYSKSLEQGGREGRRTRTVTDLEDDGRRLVHRQYVPGPGGKERLMMELIMTRKEHGSEPKR